MAISSVSALSVPSCTSYK